MSQGIVQDTPQNMQNKGFDTKYLVPSVILLGEDTSVTPNVSRRIQVDANGYLMAQMGTTVLNGQKTVAVTNTAVALTGSATSVKNGVIVQALAANAGNVVVGSSAVTTANGFQLQPGQATSIAINDVSTLYVNGTAGDGVCYIGAN